MPIGLNFSPFEYLPSLGYKKEYACKDYNIHSANEGLLSLYKPGPLCQYLKPMYSNFIHNVNAFKIFSI